MRITVPCPVCTHHLTFIATPPTLGCPFCRATITFGNGRIPVMKKVQCRRCGGVFTAESPPPAIRVIASIPEPCPVCQVVLAVRKDLPPGKKVKCGQCGTKFYPTRHAAPTAFVPPPDPVDQVEVVALAEAPLEPAVKPVSKTKLAPSKPASRTRLGPRQGGTRSSITHLALDPLEEPPPHAPAESPPAPFVPPPLGDDEIDLLSDDLGVDLEIPREAPQQRVRESSIELPEAAPPLQHPVRAPEAPHHPPMHVGNGTTSLAVELRGKPGPRVKKKKRRRPAPPMKARHETAAPVEVEVGDVEVMDKQPIAGPATVVIVAPSQPARRPQLPVAAPQPAAVIPRRPTPTGTPTITIDGKKVLTYAVPALIVAALAVWLLIGRGPSRLSVYKVEGVVLFQGEPASGARVTLFPEFNKKHRYFPSGKVGPDGKFQLTTYAPDDGAPAGRYKVTIVRGQMDMQLFEELSKTKTPEEVRRIAEDMAQDPLYSQYAEPSKSGLTAEITAGTNKPLEFKLD
jgi:ribosomal protein S27AE